MAIRKPRAIRVRSYQARVSNLRLVGLRRILRVLLEGQRGERVDVGRHTLEEALVVLDRVRVVEGNHETKDAHGQG